VKSSDTYKDVLDRQERGMPNERLRDAILRKGLTPVTVADEIGVDPKTVERWMVQDRVPYPKHRHAIAAMIGMQETYLWPNAYGPERVLAIAQSELVAVYPRRATVPPELWSRLLGQATMQIVILVDDGLFLHDLIPDLAATLVAKANAGARVEVLLADPDRAGVDRAGAERAGAERIEPDGVAPARLRKALARYEPMRGHDVATVLLHETTLYNSVYRCDDEMLVTTHVYGHPAAHAPILHLRRLAGGDLFDTYAASYERVRARARLAWPDH
jgi:lambda repressor-like predicted transcriptional regulator